MTGRKHAETTIDALEFCAIPRRTGEVIEYLEWWHGPQVDKRVSKLLWTAKVRGELKHTPTGYCATASGRRLVVARRKEQGVLCEL